MPSISISQALADRALLGAALGPIDSWAQWLVTLKAAFGEALSAEELEHFARVAGNRPLPGHRVRELWCVIGRRSGKSRIAAAIAAYLALFVDHRAYLAPGETGFVLTVSMSRDQAQAVHNYILAFIQESPVLRQEIVNVTQSEIELRNRITIATHTNSFRTIRGRTLVACVFDEVSLWRSEESATPDIEVYRAVRPALLTTRGMLVGISTPYRRSGLLHQKHRDFFGQDDPEALVVQAPSLTFNPTLDVAGVEAERRDDPESAIAEWDAEFRTDLSALLDEVVIDRAIDRGRPLELAPSTQHAYRAFVDASAGRHDAFTICLGHREGDRFVADLVRGTRPPFDANAVAAEYAQLARDYRCGFVTGDNFAGAWVQQAFEHAGMQYRKSKLAKADLYLEGLAPFNRGVISIPDHPELVRELRLLERRVHRSGKDTVDHPRHGSDDLANVLFGAAWLVLQPRETPAPVFGRQEEMSNANAAVFWRKMSGIPESRVANPQSLPVTIKLPEFKSAPDPSVGFTNTTTWVNRERG
jgi:hypothetical protein